tara:strand:+ start:10475 stop:11620 length:1146 start_codon:yes stop_codon:yes gene_type:complete
MAYYFIYPEKDTTIYSHPYRKDLNTGIVETLSLNSEKDGINNNLYYPSRFLIQFKDSDITSVIQNKITGNFSASLITYATEFSQNLPKTQTIELYPLSQSWENGTDRYLERPSNNRVISNGASWLYTDNGTTKTRWETGSGAFTGSFSGSNGGGGVWFTGSGFEFSQSFDITQNLDIDLNITSLIQKYSSSIFASQTYPTGIPNNGFIIKRMGDVFNNTSNQGSLKYFSLNTHTIFSPTLAIKWDDSSYITSSGANILTNGKIQLNISNNKQEYRPAEEYTFRINAREQYPTRTFTTSSNYLNINYLNSASYYSIEDYTSKEVIIPFDTEFTKLSADADGMYFKLDMDGLQPERYYRLLIRHDNNDGIFIYDDDTFFKVVR